VTYYYYVTAVNSVGKSAASNEVSAKPLGLPSAPSNFQALRGDRYVKLTWSPPANDSGSKIEKYMIYRNDEFLTEVGGDVYEYNDTPMNVSISYSYYVTVVNEGGESDKSDIAYVSWGVPEEPENFSARGRHFFICKVL